MTKNVVSSAGKKGGGGHGDLACRKCGGSGGGGDDGGSKQGWRKGPWTVKEDALLIEYVKNHGEKHWNCVQKIGLMRCGKSCRLRWTNHLRPDLKKGAFTSEEQRIVLQLHDKLGNKWSKIAAQLPGRTDNEIKNFWNTKMRKMKTKLQTELQIPKNSQQESNALDLGQQKNQQAQTHENPPSTPPPPPPYRSLLSPISPQKPSFNLSLPPSNLICTMQNNHTMPLLENPAYKFKFHPEEDEEDSHNINGRLLPSSSVTQTPSPQFDYGTLYNYVLPNFGNNIVSVHRRIELPSSQIHLPETYTSTILGVGCMQGKNKEDEKSWGMEERKFDLVGRMNENVGREMASISTGRELDDGNPAQSYNGMKSRKKEPVEEIESMDDDLLSLLSNFSSIESPPVWLITGGDKLNRNQKEPTATVVATSTIPIDASTTSSSQSNMP